MGDELSAERYRALSDFRYSVRRFQQFSDNAARSAGLEPRQHQMLLAIKASENATLTVGDIADRLLIRHHSAVELIRRTEERGLVTRTRGARDRRQVFVHLTSLGAQSLSWLAASHHRELQSAAPDLIRSLQRIIADDAHDG
jgi:DNA-binding MarR family transcriptional regulator